MKNAIKKLRRFTTASFAIWPFDPSELRGVHGRTVIMGLNPSAKIKFGENFHKRRFDLWYKDGFSKPPFAGAYMTDLISHPESDSSVIIRKWENDEKFRDGNVRNLYKQLHILGVTESTPILCIGQNTRGLFSSTFSEYKNVLSVNHPNSYRMKNNRSIFLADLKKIGKKIVTTCLDSKISNGGKC